MWDIGPRDPAPLSRVTGWKEDLLDRLEAMKLLLVEICLSLVPMLF
jgi:hypothetical protein